MHGTGCPGAVLLLSPAVTPSLHWIIIIITSRSFKKKITSRLEVKQEELGSSIHCCSKRFRPFWHRAKSDLRYFVVVFHVNGDKRLFVYIIYKCHNSTFFISFA